MRITEQVVIKGDFDAEGIKKEVKAVDKEISKLERKKLPLTNEFDALQKKIKETQVVMVEADKQLATGKIDKVDHFTISKEATESIEKYKSEVEKLSEEIDRLDSQLMPLWERMESLKFTGTADTSLQEIGEKAKKSLGEAAGAAGKLSEEIGKAGQQADTLGKFTDTAKQRVNSSLNSAGKAFSSFGKRISNTFKSAFIFSVLYAALNKFKNYIGSVLGTNQQLVTSLNQVKTNLSVAFQPILQTIMPALTGFMNLLVKVTAYIAAFTSAISGKSISSSVAAAKQLNQAVNNGANGANSAEKALTGAIKEKQNQVKTLQRENKALQREYEQEKKAVETQTDALEKQISSLEKSIDAIQEVEDAANRAAKAQRDAIQVNIDALEELQKSNDKRNSKEQKSFDKKIKGYQDEIKAIQKAQKAAREAEKKSQKSTASFDDLSTLNSPEEQDPYDAEVEKIQEKIDTLQAEKETASEAYELENEKIQEQIDLLQERQDAIKDVDYSAGIEAYENQIASLRERIDELNDSVAENPLIEQNELAIEKLQEEIDLLQEKKDAIQSASDTASGFDSSGLEKFKQQVADITQRIKESPLFQWLSDNKEEMKQFVIIAGSLAAAFLGAKGLFWVFTNFGTILSVLTSPAGVVVAIIGLLSALVVIGGNGEEAVNHLKDALGFFGDALSQFISGDFEGAIDSLKNGFYSLVNFGISAVEGIVNAIIKGINWCAEKINETFSFEIPDWIPKYGGETFSANLGKVSEISLERYSIPALAEGAVLPPNKPFFAMVGDQKNGTNIESPLSTIEDALRNVLTEQNFNFNISADGSLGALVRLLRLKIKQEDERETAF